MKLTKSISMFSLWAAAIAGIIGSGWLLGPMACAKIAGPASIISWVLGGILMMVVASTFVILTRAMPVAGGTVRFFQMSHGHFAGFSFSWIAWLAWVAVSPIETMALIQYSSSYIPGLMSSGVSPILTPLGMLVAMACMVIITTINNYGVKIFSKVNYIILAFKLMIPVITAVILFGHAFHPHNFTAVDGFMPYGIESIFSALPLAGVIYSFIGFNPAIQMASESKNPRKHIPIAVFGSLGVCIVLYALIQAAFIGALSFDTIKHGWSAISYAGDNGPFVGLLAGFGFVWFARVLYVDAAISPFGTAMVQAMATSRLTYAMSVNKYFPKCFQDVNRHGAPKKALLLNMVVGFCFFLPFPSWQHMVGFLVSCLVLGYIVGPMALMVMYKNKPTQFGNIHPKIMHGLCLTAFYICNLMIYWSGWDVVSKIMIMFVFGYILLAAKIIFSREKSFISMADMMRGSWVIIYIIGITAISYLGSFGGTHKIVFGSDFIYIAAFSAAIYAMANYLTTRYAMESVHQQVEHAFGEGSEL